MSAEKSNFRDVKAGLAENVSRVDGDAENVEPVS
jgi:hypothetical protein